MGSSLTWVFIVLVVFSANYLGHIAENLERIAEDLEKLVQIAKNTESL